MATEVPHIKTPAKRIGTARAAQMTGLSADTLRRAADSGKIPHIRTPGGQRRFLIADIEALNPDALADPAGSPVGGSSSVPPAEDAAGEVAVS